MKESEQYKSRGGLAEEVTSEQTSEGDESGSYGRVWRRAFQAAGGTACAKALGQDCAWHVRGRTKRLCGWNSVSKGEGWEGTGRWCRACGLWGGRNT